MIRVFIRVFSASIQSAKDDRRLIQLQRLYFFYIFAYSFLAVFFHTVMCMIYYDDPYMLNWFYSIAVTNNLVGAVIGSGSFIFVWHRLAKLCVGVPGIPVSQDMQELRIKVRRRTKNFQ